MRVAGEEDAASVKSDGPSLHSLDLRGVEEDDASLHLGIPTFSPIIFHGEASRENSSLFSR